jgi:hypothetical protein
MNNLNTLSLLICSVRDNLREAYGLSTIVDGSLLYTLRIKTIFSYLAEKEKPSLEEKKNRYLQSAILSSVDAQLNFTGEKILDFSSFKDIEKISEVLEIFTDSSKLTEKNLKKANKLLSLLEKIDRSQIEVRSTIEFDFLLIFLVVVSQSDYLAANIVARFLLFQI